MLCHNHLLFLSHDDFCLERPKEREATEAKALVTISAETWSLGEVCLLETLQSCLHIPLLYVCISKT